MAVAISKIGIIGCIHVDTTNPAPSDPFGDKPGKRLPAYGDVSLAKAVATFNAESVDLVIALGDLINGGTLGAVRNANFAQFVSKVDGVLTADMFPAYGHWDLGAGSYAATDWTAIVHTDGLGDIIPAAIAADGSEWWPIYDPDDVVDHTPAAYSFLDNGFRIIVLCAIQGHIGLDATSPTVTGESDEGGGVAEITLHDWLEARLDDAETAGESVIIVTHMPLRMKKAGVGRIPGYTDGLLLVERAGQTIKPIVIASHLHNEQSVIIENGVVHIGIGGDVWGTDENDTERFSYSVLEVTSPTWTGLDGQRGLITLTGYGHQRNEVMNMALVGRWKLNEPANISGADSILDSSGNAYHGTPAAAIVSVSAPVGRGITFDGSASKITDSAAPIVDFPLSMTAWFRTITTGSEMNIISLGGAGIANRYVGLSIMQDTGEVACFSKGQLQAHKDPASGVVVTDGVWHFVVGIWAAVDERYLYLDGALKESDAASKVLPTMDLVSIGAYADSSPSNFFNGDISDARIYSGGLSAAIIRRMWNHGAKKGFRPRFNNVSPGRVMDRTMARARI